MKNIILLVISIGVLIGGGCKKEDTKPKKHSVPTPFYSMSSGADAALIISSEHYNAIWCRKNGIYDTLDSDIDTTIAARLNNLFSVCVGPTDLVDAGSISFNEEPLILLDELIYERREDLPTPLNLNFDASITANWYATGSVDFPTFSQSRTASLPSQFSFTKDTLMDTSAAYTIQLSATPSNTDSLIYLITDEDDHVLRKTTPYFTTIATFTKSELQSTITTPMVSVQVIAYNTQRTTNNAGNKVIDLINQRIYTNAAVKIKD